MRKLYYMGKEYAGYTDNAVDMTEPKLNMTAYGTSSTAGSTITKSVITNNEDYQRVSGAYVTVTFANANTGNVSLNVDGTGSRAAYYNGARMNATNGNFAAGETVTFVYDGTYYQRIDANTDDTSILKSIVKFGWTDVLQNGQLLLKKLLSKLLNNKPKFNAPQDITNALVSGWTCPADGLLWVRAVGNADVTGYYITEQDTGIDICALYDNTRYNNTNCTTLGVVRKGHVYRQRYFAGQNRNAYYYPIVMGGGNT